MENIKKTIVDNFVKLLGIDWTPEEKQMEALSQLVEYSKINGKTRIKDYKITFIEAVNNKLDLNASAYQEVLDHAFKIHVTFHYKHKLVIRELLDSGNTDAFLVFLKENNMKEDSFIKHFHPIDEDSTWKELNHLIQTDQKYKDVIASVFSRYCFNLFDWNVSRECFSGEKVHEDFFDFIGAKYPDMCMRNHALAFVDVSSAVWKEDYSHGCNRLLSTIKEIYNNLNNHCDMVVYLPSIEGDNGKQWRLYADIILFAEKHVKEKIDRAYFRWKKIGDITKNYIDAIVPYNAEFDVAFQGFVFKDCFVIGEGKEYSLLLVFEKNKRDERIVNCPACYSKDVQGNSYPILNVRSWECENPLCPDRSKYNRGKRYAFMTLYRQKQLQNEDNYIPEPSIAKWHLDCMKTCSLPEIFEMVIRHYSCVGDEVDVYSFEKKRRKTLLNRKINYHVIQDCNIDIRKQFRDSSYFYRYIQDDSREIGDFENDKIGNARIYFGDSYDVLRTIQDSSIDGAVTSPPYYNAKTYSQWGNIYCYLYDMYNISKETFRVMKEGAVYLFNIFDYFDNENNIALSAMGDKRMILGAYMIDIFQRIGFEIVGNIIWNKGEIQGNRNFNQGNRTPYYQAPLNCWEHVLILSKGEPDKKYAELVSQIKDIHPVIKMIKGKNILGHDAPYPNDIPEMLVRNMINGDTVLDPFLGSGTTSIVANRYGVNSVGIEKNKKYYELCKHRISENLLSW